MASNTVTVTSSGPNIVTLSVTDVGATGNSTVQWVGSGVTITNINFSPPPSPPPGTSTYPTSANNWTLTYQNPTAAVNWTYTVSTSSPEHGEQTWDPEIDNVG